MGQRRQRVTEDEWHLEADYGYGWEHEHTTSTWAEMRQSLREYRANAPQGRYRARKRRVRIGGEAVTNL